MDALEINPEGHTGIYLAYLIVEEVSKTIEIINSRMYLYKAVVQTIEIINSRMYLCKGLVRGLYTDTSLNL